MRREYSWFRKNPAGKRFQACIAISPWLDRQSPYQPKPSKYFSYMTASITRAPKHTCNCG